MVNQSGYVKVVTILCQKIKMSMQAQLKTVELCPKFSEMDRVCPIELILISEIVPYMFIVVKTKEAQHGPKEHCILMPKDLKNIQVILPRSCDEEYSIYLASD